MNLEELYRGNHDAQVRLMTRILSGDVHTAEDVVQEAYARAYKYVGSYDPTRSKLNTWFNKIMFNALRDVQLEYQNRPKEDIDTVSTEDIGIKEADDTVVEAIARVQNEKHRNILHMFFICGYDSKEISEIEEKCSQTNVTTIVNRFKEKL